MLIKRVDALTITLILIILFFIYQPLFFGHVKNSININNNNNNNNNNNDNKNNNNNNYYYYNYNIKNNNNNNNNKNKNNKNNNNNNDGGNEAGIPSFESNTTSIVNEEIIYDDFKSVPIELNENEKVVKDIVMSRECEYVDLVYTWVNGSDPKHFATKQKLKNKNQRVFASSFRDIGTLKYSLRSVRQYAPWIQNIYIITADQKPDWFDSKNPDNVRFISHRDYFHNKSDLPTFNSNAIESNFWNLPVQVSNCFLYLNDDIYFSRPVNQSDYFDENFNQVVFTTKDELWTKSERLSKFDQYSKAILFTNRALASVWQEIVKRKFPAHGVQIFNRKTWYKIQEEFGTALEITSSNKFRCILDFQIGHLYNQVAMKHSNCTTKTDPDVLYILLNVDKYDQQLSLVNSSRNQRNTICLNDGLEFFNDDLQKKFDNTFNYLFPNPSPFEIRSLPFQNNFILVIIFVLLLLLILKVLITKKKISFY
ncbi:hypothetical protein ACTFIW_002350 [Dictyostelium discoideum]